MYTQIQLTMFWEYSKRRKKWPGFLWQRSRRSRSRIVAYSSSWRCHFTTRLTPKLLYGQAPSAKANNEPTMTSSCTHWLKNLLTTSSQFRAHLANDANCAAAGVYSWTTWPPLLDHNGTTSVTWLHHVNWFSNIPHGLKNSCKQKRKP